MTIGGIIFIIVVLIFIAFGALALYSVAEHGGAAIIAIAIILALGVIFGTIWYFNNTASGIRAITDQKAELNNGLDRTINVYTANGDLIASYTGKIDLEDNSGGYVLFDYNGVRYTYYNCFIESIAAID